MTNQFHKKLIAELDSQSLFYSFKNQNIWQHNNLYQKPVSFQTQKYQMRFFCRFVWLLNTNDYPDSKQLQASSERYVWTATESANKRGLLESSKVSQLLASSSNHTIQCTWHGNFNCLHKEFKWTISDENGISTHPTPSWTCWDDGTFLCNKPST